MREEYMLAVRRESVELESELIDRRIDEAFEAVYEFLEPASAQLHAILDPDGRRALDQLERAYVKALEVAARSGLGCRTCSRSDALPRQQREIPGAASAESPAAPSTPPTLDVDVVLQIRPSW
jgi:hypothetical protein